MAHKIAIPASKATIMGCNTFTPDLEAMAPVRKGKAADPACPTVAANPMPPTWSSLGSSFVRIERPTGKNGAMKNPIPCQQHNEGLKAREIDGVAYLTS
jgi:hypothetical protein